MTKTYDEINDKIRKQEAVVVTAEEMIDIVADRGTKAAAEHVDVVTTGTFGPMCSSGALLNLKHATPRMKIQHARLNDVPAYGGIAAADLYLGATELPREDRANEHHPGAFPYGGGHVIEELVAGKEVQLVAEAYGTDCYPRQQLAQPLRLTDCGDAQLLNPRNGYQNYNVAVNATASRPIYTYLGILQPGLANASYCSAGQLSPLLNDPHYRTIGIGSRIFLGGGVGYVYFRGTQHAPEVERTASGIPRTGAGTLAVVGDLKGMSPAYLRGVSLRGYGVSLAVGLGVPIPILDEDMARCTAVRDEDIEAPVVDYGHDYPHNTGQVLDHVTYAQLRAGTVDVCGRQVRAAGMSSYAKARTIAGELKRWIGAGWFELGQPSQPLPAPGLAPLGSAAPSTSRLVRSASPARLTREAAP